MELTQGTKGDVDAAIKRLEEAVVWRRSVAIDDVEAMAKDCEPEVGIARAAAHSSPR